MPWFWLYCVHFILAGCGGDGKKETADKGKSGGSASETGVDSGKEGGGIAAEEKAKVTGEIMIEGSSTVEPISNQAKLGFNSRLRQMLRSQLAAKEPATVSNRSQRVKRIFLTLLVRLNRKSLMDARKTRSNSTSCPLPMTV